MRALEFTEDNIGTNPKRPSRPGTRHHRGHEPIPRYRSAEVDEAESEKVGGKYDPEEFDAMVSRLGQKAKQGPMKTVWDPVKRVYKNVPINQSNDKK